MPPVPARLRLVMRRLLRTPMFSLVATFTLALGIGANTAIFSVINGVLLKPLPYKDPDRLVGVWHTAPGINIPALNQAPSTYLTYREEGKTFEDIGLWDNTAVTVTGAGEPERIEAMIVTDGTLPLLGVEAAIGRRFSREDDTPGTPERVMLSYGYWQRKFGGDPTVVGRGITIDGRPREIIGVLPEGFRILDRQAQVYVPLRLDRGRVFVGQFNYQGIARLKPGVTIEQANADIARLLPTLPDRFPLPPGFTRRMFDDAKIGPNVRPLSEDVVGDVGSVLWVLLGTVGFVLLIACANVANLFLVRAEGRQQELAIHVALGATRRRIAAELLSESVTLALAGGALGLGLAYGAIRLLVAVGPEALPRLHEIAIDPAVLFFTAAVSLLAGVLFGAIPVLKFARPQIAGALKEGGRLSSAGRERHRARNTIVVVEIALAVVLLVASGLMIRTFQALRRVDPGFTRPEEVLTVRITIPPTLVEDPVQAARTHEQIARRVEQIPGVASVGVSTSITMDGNDSNDPVFVEDHPTPEGRIPRVRRFKWIGENYFETMGNALLFGRTITWNDVYTMAPVVVVTENFAQEFWKDPSLAVGRRIRVGPTTPWKTIVGVVGDARDDGVTQPAPTIVYWPLITKGLWRADEVQAMRSVGYAIRSPRTGTEPLLKDVQQAVWAVNPSLPVAFVRTLDEIRAESMGRTSFALVMLSIAAGVALLLGVVGIYGVISYVAAQRTREIGIRIALGAATRDVSALFLRHGLLLAAIGIGLGTAAAAALTRVMSAMLFGVSRLDILTYAAAAAALGATALLATYLPAARAARVDPATALRWDG